jgi:DNA polymerase III subunit delta
MIYILTGPDDFSKNEFLSNLQNEQKLLVVSFFDDSDEKEVIRACNNSDLFGDRKLIKAYGFFKKLSDSEKFFNEIASASNDTAFIEESLDKRKTETKKILADKRITVIDFPIPQGLEFKKWVIDRAKKYNIQFGTKALDLFLERLGFSNSQNDEPLYNLWQADSELKKLSLFSNGQTIEAKEVQSLVPENIDDDVFKLTNALGDKNKQLVLKHLHSYMDSDIATDEKSKVIAIVGLLSEQFRSMLMIKDAESQKISDSELAKITGYSPGRIFIYKKISKRFNEAKILEVLKKLEALDEETKSGNGPVRLQLLMIMESLLR